jgi:LPXTG-motif cell wall-anchored protein
MVKRFRALLLVGLVAAFGFGIAGIASAQQPIPPGASKDCVTEVMNLPALNVCKDAQGRNILELPAIGELREPSTPAPAKSGGTLPKTGMHTEDFAAIGLAALAGGAVLVRRMRLAVA